MIGGVCSTMEERGYGQMAGTCECGNEPSGSINCGEFVG